MTAHWTKLLRIVWISLVTCLVAVMASGCGPL